MKAGRLILVFLFLILGSAVAQLGLPTTNVSGGFRPPPLDSIEATQTNRDIDRIIIFLTTPLESNRSIEATQTNHKLTQPNPFEQFVAPAAAGNPYEKMVDTGENPYTKLTPPVKVQKADDFLNQFDTPKPSSADKFLDQFQPALDLEPSGSSLRLNSGKAPRSGGTVLSTPQNIKRAHLLDDLVEANAESQRRFEQVIAQQQQQRTLEEQQRALEDIARQLQLLQFQQEEDALLAERIEGDRKLQQIRLQLEDGAMRQRISSRPVQPILVSPPVVVSAHSYDPNSLANPYGAGSPYKADGLMNPYSQYGSPYSSKSWRNPYATDTPKLYDSQGNYAGKLSSNPYDPDSTANPYGRYGSPYSPQSINNPYGLGSPYRTDPVYVVPSP